MRDKTVSYVDLLRPGPSKSRKNDEKNPMHVGGWKHGNIVDRHSRHVKLYM
jgi:hypothetical protein